MKIRYACCLLLLPACACRPHIEPDGRAVLTYVRNAQVGAPVRRLWPQGQDYVDNVLNAQAAYRTSVHSLDPAEDLWPLDSRRWQSAEALILRIEAFNQLLSKPGAPSADSDAAPKEKETPKTREELRQALRDAVAALPKGLSEDELSDLDLQTNVWSAVKMDDPPLHEASVAAQLTLLEDHLALCMAAKEALAEDEKAPVAARISSMHADLLSRILANLEERRKVLQARKIELEILHANRKSQLEQEKEAGNTALISDLRYERDYAQAAMEHAQDAIEALEERAKALTEKEQPAAGAPDTTPAADQEAATL